MIVPDGLLAAPWAAVGWAIALSIAALAGLAAARRRQAGQAPLGPRRFDVHAWFATVLALAIVWQIAFQAEHGVGLHFLGAFVAVAMFGPLAAGLALAAALAAVTLNTGVGWASYGLNALLLAVWPVAFAATWLRLVHRWLPHHLFVYIFANGFFGAGATVLATGALAAGLLAAGSAQPFAYLGDSGFVSVLLLAFSEAWLSGMLLTLLVVYRPRWVTSFDDRDYMLTK